MTAITVEETPDPTLRDAILKPLRAFNEAAMGTVGNAPFALVLRDPQTGAVSGGAWGVSALRWMFIELLVVPENLRGQGIGTSLMQAAEDLAVKRDCEGVYLDTFTFQAPGFYEKLGYRQFGELAGFPPGHSRRWYAKRF